MAKQTVQYFFPRKRDQGPNLSHSSGHNHSAYLRIYRVSQEECARLQESVPYVKVTDITKNTYIQS